MSARLSLGCVLALAASLGSFLVVACSSSGAVDGDSADAGDKSDVDGRDQGPPYGEDAGVPDVDAAVSPPTYDFSVQCGGAPCVTGLSARGGSHACVVVKDGSVRCWGSNESGQLGTGPSDAAPMPRFDPMPRVVAGVANATSVAATGDGVHGTTCVVTAAGAVTCFGSDAHGQLGRGEAPSSAPHPDPADVPGLEAEAVTLAGTFALAVGVDGRLWSWGKNDVQQLARLPGDAGVSPSAPAWADRIASPARSLAGTSKNGFLITEDGAVLSWGGAVGSQLARASSLVADPVPTAVALSDVTSITAGASHACAASRSGSVSCWGDNAHGQLGIGTKGSQLRPVHVLLPDGVQAVSVIAGGDDTCIIAASGELYCWGANDTGQVGVSGGGGQPSPRRIDGLGEQVVSAAVMDGAVCALRRGGTVVCWGDNLAGQLGRGTRDQEIHVEPAPIVIE